jgi:hypothetical protein
MYVVVVAGETDFVPPTTGVVLPMLLSREKEVAFVVAQVSVEDEPV